jgi:Flp pilus assembly pilin Flp
MPKAGHSILAESVPLRAGIQIPKRGKMQVLSSFLNWLGARVQSGEEGQTLVEYALIIALVSVALVAALSLLATNIGNVFANIEAAF